MALPKSMAAALVAAACGTALAQPAVVGPAKGTETQSASAVRISPERLAAIRQALAAQVATYDAAENAMRHPTAAEAASLSAAASVQGTPRIIALPGGGMALRQDPSNLNYLIVDIGSDGKAAMRHGSSQSIGSNDATTKGGKHVH